jgi:hypothetical protein
VTRSLAPTIGLLVALAPALACAQTNLDQGKSASQIFASACIECHKAPQGLAHGKSSATIADFLREHYTTNAQQAAALAAYVVGGRDTGAAPQGRGQKPAADQGTASTEAPKPETRSGRQPSKPEEGTAASKLHPPFGQRGKPVQQASPSEQPNIMAPQPATASRTRRNDPRTPLAPAHEPAAVAHAPGAPVTESPTTETQPQEASPPSAAVAPARATPADAASGESDENAPAPRDHIPD